MVLERVKRQLEMAGEHLTSDEVDQMLDSNSSDIFYRQLNPLSLAGRIALEDAANRHNEILNLEASIRELNEIFQDVFDMVRSQVAAYGFVFNAYEFRENWWITSRRTSRPPPTIPPKRVRTSSKPSFTRSRH